MQLEHVGAAAAEYSPPLQSVHALAPEPDDLPATHATHSLALVFDHVPPSHLVHALLAGSIGGAPPRERESVSVVVESLPPTQLEQLRERAGE